jgi:hypothetical protein
MLRICLDLIWIKEVENLGYYVRRNLYSSTIARIVKPMTLLWTGNIVRVGEEVNCFYETIL